MNIKRIIRNDDYEREVKDMNRNQKICEVSSVQSLKKEAKKIIFIGGTCLSAGVGCTIATGIFSSIGVDPMLMTISGASAIAGYGIGGSLLYTGIDKLNCTNDKLEILKKYVDKDIKETYELTKKK